MISKAQLRSRSRAADAGSDETLVEQSLAGDRSAFETLVRRHRRPLVNHLYRHVGSEEGASDLAQEVFLKVYLSLSTFDPSYRFTTWLYRIASNCAIDHMRRKRPPTCSLSSAGDGSGPGPDASIAGNEPAPDDLLCYHELHERLESAIGALPAGFRQLILLRHRLYCRYDEIARITDLPIGTVKNRIFRAREMLRERLVDLLPDEV